MVATARMATRLVTWYHCGKLWRQPGYTAICLLRRGRVTTRTAEMTRYEVDEELRMFQIALDQPMLQLGFLRSNSDVPPKTNTYRHSPKQIRPKQILLCPGIVRIARSSRALQRTALVHSACRCTPTARCTSVVASASSSASSVSSRACSASASWLLRAAQLRRVPQSQEFHHLLEQIISRKYFAQQQK
jgi:hypothetical protein